MTEEVEGERLRREGEERYRALVETAQNGIMVIDGDGRALLVNDSLCHMLGYTRDELSRMTMLRVIHPEERALTSRRLAARLRGATPARETYQTRYVRKDGAVIDVEVSASRFVEGGRTVGSLVEARDVTEQLRLREQLLQARKMEAVGTLVAGVAHDFNNALAAIGGSIELAQDEAPSPWLDKAQVAADHAADLVRQLLQFSRRDAPERTVVDLRELAVETEALARQTFDRSIEMRVDLPPEPVHVSVDRGQISQVLMNLLVNARDAVTEAAATPGRASTYLPRICVSIARSPEERGELEQWAELTVGDNGPGIRPEARGRIFEPFFTTKDSSRGTGLGLSTAYAIVKDHDGRLDVESARGTTRFTIRLPACSAPAESTAVAAPAAAPRADGERVLVVDDEPALVQILERTLMHAGYRVTCAAGGEGGLRMARDGRFDLVLLDVNMPAPNGWQMLDELLAADPQARVLMLSGFAIEGEAMRRGAIGLLPKPFDREMVLEAVATALAC